MSPKVGQMTLCMMTMAQNVASKLDRAEKIRTYRIPIDIRDSSFQVHARTEDLNAAVSNVSKMSIDAMMELQLKHSQNI